MKSNVHIRLVLLATLATLSTIMSARSQHHAGAHSAPLSFHPVLTTQLSDSELKNYKMISQVLTVAPGAIDTVKHRHDCELFGYVLNGEVQIGLGTESEKKFSAGQMFYEPYKILHYSLRNMSNQEAANILLFFIIKDGRQGYIREHPVKLEK
jgi:mannose-6-phosphate isomerase-like protein (cupin superfamily)